MNIALRLMALPVTIFYAFAAVITQDPARFDREARREYYADAAIFSMNMMLKGGE